MEAPIITRNSFLNTIEIEYNEEKYTCKFKIIEESIYVSIFLLNILKFKGSITLEKIKEQNFHFSENNIEDVLEELNHLNLQNFSLTNCDYKT